MTVLQSGISWCSGTLNLTVGCTKVSAGCEFCYAEEIVTYLFGQDFAELRYHEKRLNDLRKLVPYAQDGILLPYLCFVNSMSDFFHEHIPIGFIHRCLDAFEQYPDTVFQILTKRPARMRKVIAERYKNGLPAHFWLGVSVEDDRVKGRLNIVRRLKDQVGEFTLFVSIEPITASCAAIDLTGVDQVLTGGESKRRGMPRKMEFVHLEQANEKALSAGIPLHFKQYGHLQNNPYAQQISREEKVSLTRGFHLAVERGLELASHEKGGATYKGRVIQEKPPAYWRMVDRLNSQKGLGI